MQNRKLVCPTGAKQIIYRRRKKMLAYCTGHKIHKTKCNSLSELMLLLLVLLLGRRMMMVMMMMMFFSKLLSIKFFTFFRLFFCFISMVLKPYFNLKKNDIVLNKIKELFVNKLVLVLIEEYLQDFHVLVHLNIFVV